MNLRHNEMHKPTMSYDTALDQAGNTPWCYMDKAVEAIDAKFGAGYSKKNPNLVARYMEVAGREFTNSTLIKVLWEIAEAIDRSNFTMDERISIGR